MHRFTVVSFLAVSMTALSVVFGNPVDNPTTGMTNPKLYRRETKELMLNFVASIFRPHDDVFVKENNNFFCLKPNRSNIVDALPMLFGERYVAQGVYFEDTKQWYRLAESQNGKSPTECYEHAQGPETRNKAKLKPFTSVVTKFYKPGTTLFIKELNGIIVDNNVEHNGCVIVVDNYSFDGDLSMYTYTARRREMFPDKMYKVTVIEDKHCEIKQYELGEGPTFSTVPPK